MLLPNAIMNNGEACIAQTRILAPRDRYQEVVDALVESVSAMKVGDPLDPDRRGRPARGRAPARPGRGVHQDRPGRGGQGRHRRRPSRRHGQGLVRRAHRLRRTWTTRCASPRRRSSARCWPSSPTTAATTRPSAIANDSNYGLCGSVWTGDPERGLKVARGVRTGTYMLNSPDPHRLLHPLRRLQGVGHGPRVRSRRPRAVPREEVDQPAGGLQPLDVI